MRPGQELSWTQLSINQNGSSKNNMIVGVLNSPSMVILMDSVSIDGTSWTSLPGMSLGLTVALDG